MYTCSLEDMRNKIGNYQTKYDRNELFKYCLNYQTINDIREDMIIFNCFDDFHIENNDLIQSLQNCEYSRIRFSILLQYIAERYAIKNVIEQYIEELLNISNLWGQIRKVTIKSLISGNNNDEIIYELIDQICLVEEKVMEKLSNFLCNFKANL